MTGTTTTGMPTTGMTDTAPDSIGIAAPREWIQIPVDRPSFDTFCVELEKNWVEAQWDRTTRRQAELLLNRIRRELRRVGVQYASMYIAEPDDRDSNVDLDDRVDLDDLGGPGDEVMMACCTIGHYGKEQLGTTTDLSLTNLVMAYGKRPDRDDPNTRERITNLEPPVLHPMPVGKSVRLRRLYEFPEPGILPQRYYGETYLTPTTESGEHLLVTNFTTVNLPLAREFSELFEAMAGTIELFHPGEPTRFDSAWVDDTDPD